MVESGSIIRQQSTKQVLVVVIGPTIRELIALHRTALLDLDNRKALYLVAVWRRLN